KTHLSQGKGAAASFLPLLLASIFTRLQISRKPAPMKRRLRLACGTKNGNVLASKIRPWIARMHAQSAAFRTRDEQQRTAHDYAGNPKNWWKEHPVPRPGFNL